MGGQIAVQLFLGIDAGTAGIHGVQSKIHPGIKLPKLVIFVRIFQGRGAGEDGHIVGSMAFMEPVEKLGNIVDPGTYPGNAQVPANIYRRASRYIAVTAFVQVFGMKAVLDLSGIFGKGDDHGNITFGKFRESFLGGKDIRLGIAKTFFKACHGTGILRGIQAQMAMGVKKTAAVAPQARLKFQSQLFVQPHGDGRTIFCGRVVVEFSGEESGDGIEFFPGLRRTQGKRVIFLVF